MHLMNRNSRFVLSVTCNDADTESFIKSYIRRELRGLRDVEIVNIESSDDNINSWDNGWDSGRFDLSILSIKEKTTEIISVCFEFRERFDFLNIKAAINRRGLLARRELENFESSLSKKQRTALTFFTMFLSHTPPHGKYSGIMLTISKNKLEEMCKTIVVQFDTNVLEKAREER